MPFGGGAKPEPWSVVDGLILFKGRVCGGNVVRAPGRLGARSWRGA